MNIRKRFFNIFNYPHLFLNRIKKVASNTGIDTLLGNGWSFLPSSIVLIPTLKCNLQCITCGLKENLSQSDRIPGELNPTDELPRDHISKVIDSIAFFKPTVQIGGGEPFLYTHIQEILEQLVKKYKLFVNILTNGLLLDAFAEIIVDLEIPFITISIDGVEDSFDRIRGDGSFEKLHNSLIKLIEKKHSKQSKLPFLEAVFVATPLNQYDLIKTAQYTMDLGFDRFHVQHMISINKEFINHHNEHVRNEYDSFKWTWGHKLNYHDMDIPHLKQSIAEARQLVNNHEGCSFKSSPDLARFSYEDYYSEKPLPKEKRTPCKLFYQVTMIYPDGNILPSGGCYFHIMGNIFRKSFKEIWNGPKYRFLRQRQKLNQWIPICDKCHIPYGTF